MTKRLATVLLGLTVGGSLVFNLFAAGDFWNDKPSSEWSEKEIQRLLTKSPWAKEVDPKMNFSPGGPDGPGPPPGGPGGPGPGGPDGEFPEIKAVVPWESAALIREAVQRELAQDRSECYVVSISGIPLPGSDSAGDPGQAPIDGGRTDQMESRLQKAASLQWKGKAPLVPARLTTESDGTLLFFFPCAAGNLSLEDKEVSFQLRTGPMELKTSFR